MNAPSDINPELQKQIDEILAALRRAKRRAEDLAIATGTKLVESEGGEIRLLGPAEILARRGNNSASR